MTAEKSIKGCGNVFLDLGFPQDEAELLQAQANKMIVSAKETQYLLICPHFNGQLSGRLNVSQFEVYRR